MPPQFWQGVAEFNQQQFYACHDTLEALWIDTVGPDKQFVQGILQVAVGLYHLSNLNWRGAVILMGEGCNRLSSYGDDYGGLQVEAFLTDTVELLQTLQELGPDLAESAAIQLGLRSTESPPPALALPADLQLPVLQRTAETS